MFRPAWPITLLLAWLAVPAFAQVYPPDFSVVRQPVSVRAAGMGGAGTAVLWDDELDVWANPALAGLMSGVSAGWTRIGPGNLPELDSSVSFDADRYALGAFGLGAQLQYSRLDLGVLRFPDSLGLPPYDQGEERTRGWSAGVSLGSVANAVLGGGETPADWRRRIDVGFGMAERKLSDDVQGVEYGDATLRDWGTYVRWTPFVNSPEGASGSQRIDVSYAHSVQNHRNARQRIDDPFSPSILLQLPRTQRDGAALHYAYRRGFGEGFPGSLSALFNAGLDPAIALTIAWDVERVAPTPGRFQAFDVTRFGAELTALRVLTLRAGQVDSPAEGRVGASWGLGLTLPVGRLAGVRWDYASEPIAATAADERRGRQSIVVWVNPLGLGSGRPGR